MVVPRLREWDGQYLPGSEESLPDSPEVGSSCDLFDEERSDILISEFFVDTQEVYLCGFYVSILDLQIDENSRNEGDHFLVLRDSNAES